MMPWIQFLSVALAAFMAITPRALTPVDVRDRVARFTPVEFGPDAKIALVGKYTSTSEELRHRVGPALSGEYLHLFSDGTYIHVDWTDVSLPVIDDKGLWQVANNVVTLRSDESITWPVYLERQFVVLRRPTRRREVLLLGVHRQLSFFESKANDSHNPEILLLITTIAREERYTASRGAAVKSQLLREAWNPKFFAH